MYFRRTMHYGGMSISLCVGGMLMGWSKSFLLRPLIPKICSCQQVLLTRQPRDGSRVNEPETAEETAFDILLTLKSQAKKIFSKKGHFRFGQIQGFGKIS